MSSHIHKAATFTDTDFFFKPFRYDDELPFPTYFWPLSSIFAALGFMPGKEVKAEKVGNLGLQDR